MWLEFILTGLFIFLLWLPFKRPGNYPPGYWGFPLIGYIPFKKDVEHVLTGLHLKFGKIVCWRIGTRLFVSINDYDLGKEALNGPLYLDRPDFFSAVHSLYIGENLGVIGSVGLQWVNGRRFTLRHLRNFGMGKSRLVASIQEQAMNLVAELKKKDGKATSIPNALHIAILNVIWNMVASKQYTFDDPEINAFSKMVTVYLHQISSTVFPYFFPWAKMFVPNFLYRKITQQEFVEEYIVKFTRYFNDIIDEHEKNFNEDDPKDYIEAYLAEMKKTDGEEDSTLSRKDLASIIHDLFLAGSETTTTMAQWAFYYLAAFPKVQERIQKELDKALPNRIQVSIDDKKEVPYTEAFLCELNRHVSMSYIGGFHLSTHESKLGTYTIPKGTCIFVYAKGCHYNLSHWKHPEEFNPNRFLDETGNFVLPKKGFMPFGIGKRQCLGESLAKMELLILIATILQHFTISPPVGKEMDISPDKNNPFFQAPKVSLDIVFTSR